MKRRGMGKPLGLRSRLFISHMLVMIVSLTCYILINRWSAFRYFAYYLDDMVLHQSGVLPLKSLISEGFLSAWRAGTAWSLLVGAVCALSLSYWVSQRITAPLTQMEEMTQYFAAGKLDTRLSSSDIPEIDRLARSFNRMALRLDQVESKRRELVGDLAHELRTPLTIVRGYLEELADERIEASATIFHRIIREVRRLERLVIDLQLLSKAEAGHLPLDLQSFPLNLLLEDVKDIFLTQIREDGPTLQLDYPADMPWVWADPDRTEQILVNLIGNALRYTEHGQITVQAIPDISQIRITVTDTGTGIALEDLPHVFDRFWRSQHSRTRNSDGSGLGLTITRRLVELQGGTISAMSELGQGSQFQFSIPLRDTRL